MMVVKVEIWPGGYVEYAREIARVGIVNRTGAKALADYNVIGLLDRDTDTERVTQSAVLDHIRRAGWRRLVVDSLAQLEGDVVSHEYVDEIATILRKG